MTRMVRLLLMCGLVMLAAGPAAAATPLNFGDTVNHTICNGTVDSLRFTAAAGDRICIAITECYDMGGSCSPGCCCFDQAAELHDGGGTLVAQTSTGIQSNCCGCQPRPTLSDVLIPSSGVYVITVQDTAKLYQVGQIVNSTVSDAGLTKIDAVTIIKVVSAGVLAYTDSAGALHYMSQIEFI